MASAATELPPMTARAVLSKGFPTTETSVAVESGGMAATTPGVLKRWRLRSVGFCESCIGHNKDEVKAIL